MNIINNKSMSLEELLCMRESHINAASDTMPIALSDTNKKSALLHPIVQRAVVKEVLPQGTNAATFILGTTDGSPLAWFRAGQYISIALKIGGSTVTRAYSLCSSPSDSLKGIYAITIRRDVWASTWILDNWKIGSAVEFSAPQGEFVYEPIRDTPHIIGIAGGSGVTPFISMAQALRDGVEDFQLTLLYGCRTKADSFFKDELQSLQTQCSKFNVIYVLSEQNDPLCEHGFITAEIINKYMHNQPTSLFICGPQAMYSFLENETSKLGLRRKFIRREVFGSIRDPRKMPGWPSGNENREFSITVKQQSNTYHIPAQGGESVLIALERAGIEAQSLCRSGSCGYCHAKLASGSVYVPEDQDGRRAADLYFGYIHPCCSWPVTDLSIEL